MEITVREVKPSGLSECLEIIHRSFAPVAERFHHTEINCPTHAAFIPLERLIFESQNGVDMLCICEGEKAIGFVGLDKRESELMIDHLCILPEKQGSGYGQKLMEHAFEWASQMGYTRISLNINDADKKLKDFFIKMGFKEDCKREISHLPFTLCFMIREK